MVSSSEIQMIVSQLDRLAEKHDTLHGGLAEVSVHLARVSERCEHLATREDVSTAIQTHAAACKASRIPPAKRADGYDTPADLRRSVLSRGTLRLIKAIAVFLTAIGAGVLTWFGVN